MAITINAMARTDSANCVARIRIPPLTPRAARSTKMSMNALMRLRSSRGSGMYSSSIPVRVSVYRVEASMSRTPEVVRMLGAATVPTEAAASEIGMICSVPPTPKRRITTVVRNNWNMISVRLRYRP